MNLYINSADIDKGLLADEIAASSKRSTPRAIFSSIASVALGNSGGAAKFIENILAKGMMLLIDFLARLPGQEVKFEVRDDEPASILAIRKVEVVLGRRLPDGMLAFYRCINGLKLDWKSNDASDQGGSQNCSAHILPLRHVSGGFGFNLDWHGEIFKDIISFENNDDASEFAKQCKIICAEHGNHTVVHFAPDKEEPDLYYTEQGRFLPLAISFAEFIECFLETRGLNYWQFFRTKITEDTSDTWLAGHSPFHQNMKALFPEVDLSKYRKPPGVK